MNKVTRSLLQHVRDDCSGSEHARHNVHVPHTLPVFVGTFQATLHGNTGVRTENVDGSTFCNGGFDESNNVLLNGHITGNRQATDFVRNFFGRRKINVRNDNSGSTGSRKATAHGRANSVGPTRNDDNFIGQIHASDLLNSKTRLCLRPFELPLGNAPLWL